MATYTASLSSVTTSTVGHSTWEAQLDASWDSWTSSLTGIAGDLHIYIAPDYTTSVAVATVHFAQASITISASGLDSDTTYTIPQGTVSVGHLGSDTVQLTFNSPVTFTTAPVTPTEGQWSDVASKVKSHAISAASGRVAFEAQRTDTSTTARFGIEAGGYAHGVWSNKKNDWLIYNDGTNTIYDGRIFGGWYLIGKTDTGTSTPRSISVALPATEPHSIKVIAAGWPAGGGIATFNLQLLDSSDQTITMDQAYIRTTTSGVDSDSSQKQYIAQLGGVSTGDSCSLIVAESQKSAASNYRSWAYRAFEDTTNPVVKSGGARQTSNTQIKAIQLYEAINAVGAKMSLEVWGRDW